MMNLNFLCEEQKIDELLRMELKTNGIDILEKYESLYPNLYIILKKMLYIKEHEGKLPKLGIIFSNKDLSEYAEEILYFENKDTDISLRLSDGENSFLWFKSNEVLNGIVLFDKLKNNEYNLLSSATEMDSIIFTYNNGETKIFGNGNIYIHKNRKWKIKDGIGNKIDRILELTDYKYPTVMRKLIEFAYYELSPRKIGSTLVYLLDENYNEELNPPLKFSEYKINFRKLNHSHLVKNFLKQIDGATLILPNGDIWGTGLHLQYSQKSKEIILEEGGTRHTSAKRFSFDYGNTVIVVSSEDGPVTIYSDGRRFPLFLSSLEFNKQFPGIKQRFAEEESTIISDLTRCKKCNKLYRVEAIKSGILDRTKTLYCKVCGEEIYKIKAKNVDHEIVKKIEVSTNGNNCKQIKG